MADQDSEIALLAPVPLEHLESGLLKCASAGQVAFGSDSGMVLTELAAYASSADCPVLFYASHPGSMPPTVTWTGCFAGLKGKNDAKAFRPGSTDSDGEFLIYYVVADLKKLAANQHLLISSLKTSKGKKLAKTFVPIGPTLIENPF